MYKNGQVSIKKASATIK